MERATAAQLAARNIKSAKKRQPQKPVQSIPSTQQSMSFGGGASFGSTLQGSGSTFNFSSSGPSLSFPPSNNIFGVPSKEETPNSSGHRPDSTGEEAKRVHRPFQQGGAIMENAFGASQNPFATSQQAANPFASNFGGSQTSSSSPFNSTPQQEKPASGMFNFNAPGPTASVNGTSFNFGSRPGQNQPANNIFGGLSQQPTQTQSPAPTQNLFGSSSTPSSSASFNFGGSASTKPQSSGASITATAAPSNNLFGGFKTGSTPNIFSSGQSTAPTPNIFASAPSTTSTSSVFANPTSTASAPNIFSNSVSSASPTPNIFANSTSTASAPSIFTSQPSTVSSLFGQPQQNSTSNNNSINNIFGGLSQPNGNISADSAQSPTKSIFDSSTASEPAPTNNIFGPLSKPTDKPSVPTSTTQTSEPNAIFGSDMASASTPKASSSSLFDRISKDANGNPRYDESVKKSESTPSQSLFGASPTPVAQQSLPASNLFGASKKPASTTIDLFSNLNKPVDQSVAQPKPAAGLVNGSENKKTASVAAVSEGPLGKSGNIFGALGPAKPTSIESAKATQSTPSFLFGSPSATPPGAIGSSLFSPSKTDNTPKSTTQPKSNGASLDLQQQSQTSLKSSNGSVIANNSPLNPASTAVTNGKTGAVAFAEMVAASTYTDEQMQDLVPKEFSEQQKNQFFTAYRLRSLNMAMQKFFATVPATLDISEALTFFTEKREDILARDEVAGSQRKVSAGQQQESENPSKQIKAGGIFSSMPAQPERQSPEKSGRQAPRFQSTLSNGTPSQAPSFVAPAPSLLPKSPSPTKAQPVSQLKPTSQSLFPDQSATPSPSKSKRKADEQLTKDMHEAHERELESNKKATANGILSTSSGSNTSNIFKSIVDSPSESTPTKRIKATANPGVQSSTDDSRPNPFANLPIPESVVAAASTSTTNTPSNSSLFGTSTPKASGNAAPGFAPESSAFSAQTAAPAGNIFAKSTAPGISANPFSLKDAVRPTSTMANPFTLKTMEPAKSPDPTANEQAAPKPPTFGTAGSTPDFMKQFTQKASQDHEKNEKKLMEDAKAEDFDSEEEDEAEWVAKYRAKRKAELKEIEEIAKNKQTIFSLKNTFTPSQAQAAPAKSTPSANKNIFGVSTPSVLSSGASTPSVLSSTQGHDKFDGLGSQSNNIFGFLNTPSAASEDQDGDDDATDGSDNDNLAKDDSEADAGEDEEAAKEKVLFKKALAENQTASTPKSKGSLFDRITDQNGNKVDFDSEEKENTKPAPKPADFTWKPETPIKFGNSTPTAKPSVSITAPTPSKSISNLFGISATSKLAAPASGVGFSFGSGQISGASSLFPSTAVSTATSRATSPGLTTDGDSEVDPDAEKHEQIDLTAGGPGEEDEEVLHEVRAKGVLWEPGNDDKDGSWVTKGLGPLRILKNKQTGASRILLRQDPRGTVVINSTIIRQSYVPTGKTLKMVVPASGGMQTWVLQVKTPESAEKLAAVLEENKVS